MEVQRPDPEFHITWTRTANDRWKAGWDTRLGWSTVAAVAIHVVLFVALPSWQAPDLRSEPDPELSPIEWIALYEAASRGGGRPVAAAPVGVGEDSLTADSDAEGGLTDEPDEMAGLSDALLDRLRRQASFRPVLSQPEPVPDPRDDGTAEDGEEEESLSIRGSASTSDLESLPESSPLDMDRLSSVRPQLALTSVSVWVLVRNPAEVTDFMRRTYQRGVLNREEGGAVSVTLWIDRTGSVEWSEVHQSSGNRRLDDVALRLFSDVASFRPAQEEGVPVGRSVFFTLIFPW